jgi:hypothetical protein
VGEGRSKDKEYIGEKGGGQKQREQEVKNKEERWKASKREHNA